MNAIKKLFYINTLMLVVAASSAYAAPVFVVTPSILTDTVNLNGMGVVKYTVTNNTSQTINQITVNPAYQTTGSSLSGTSLQNDSCSNATLASQASCTFQLVFSGAQQTAAVTLSPKICGFNGIFCSVPVLTLRTQVTVVSQASVPNAYFGLSNLGQLQPILTSTNALLPSISGFNFSGGAGIAVSKDGTKVYVANTGLHNMIIYNVTQGTTTTVPLALPLHAAQRERSHTVSALLGGIAVTPDGSKVYITDGSNGIWVYNTSLGQIVANITNPTYLTRPFAIAASPDGAFIYVSSLNIVTTTAGKQQSHRVPAAGYVVAISTATNSITNAVQVGSSGGIAVSPDGSQLYVVGVGPVGHHFRGASSNLLILNTSSLSTVATVSLAGLGATFVAVAPNGNTAYVTDNTQNISVINLATLTHTEIPLTLTPYGIAVTPDGSKAFISSFTGTNIGVLNIGSGAVSYVNVGDSQSTFGSFIG